MTELKASSPEDGSDILIHHYTGQDGLRGIIETRQIWATHIRYLNDLREVMAGEDAFRLVAKGKFPFSSGVSEEQLSSGVNNVLDLIRDLDVFVASFSAAKHGDSLSLWRAYTSGGVGFSLGFSLEKLRASIEIAGAGSTEKLEGRWLSKVVYVDPGSPRSLWPSEMQMFDTVFGFLGYKIDKAAGDKEVSSKAVWPLSRFFSTLKDAAFEEEAEYRIVQIGSPNDGFSGSEGLSYRNGSYSIIPYCTIKIPIGNDPLNALRRIVVGPTSHPNEAVKAVKMLLSTNSIEVMDEHSSSGVEVVASTVPYRNW